jgi:hypothetical protein
MVLKVYHFEELLRLLQLVIGESRIRMYQDSVPQGEYILQVQAVEESHICRCQDLEPQEGHRLEEAASSGAAGACPGPKARCVNSSSSGAPSSGAASSGAASSGAAGSSVGRSI